MILATDVHYTNSIAMVAGVLFRQWDAESPEHEYTCKVEGIAPYESGNFYKRELPCLLALLNKHHLTVGCIVVDGYVHLDEDMRPGLGKVLFDALGGTVPIIGVAKNPFPGIGDNHKIMRGKSKNPLYVTTTGNLTDAKNNIEGMYGEFRIPKLLKRADQLCRSEVQ